MLITKIVHTADALASAGTNAADHCGSAGPVSSEAAEPLALKKIKLFCLTGWNLRMLKDQLTQTITVRMLLPCAVDIASLPGVSLSDGAHWVMPVPETSTVNHLCHSVATTPNNCPPVSIRVMPAQTTPSEKN